MREITMEDLSAVTYLDTSNLGNRTVNLMPLWDGQGWNMWVPGPHGLINMKPIDAMQVDYVATQPARESDLFIPFVDLMWQRASWPEICPFISAICDDFHNMGTSLAKLRLFFNSRHLVEPGSTSNFAATEVEYLIILARTIFDLLQETIARLWSNYVSLNDEEAERRRRGRGLPDTFSKLVLREKRTLKSVSEIAEQYGIPDVLAAEYSKSAAFFAELRNMRDRIVHGGGGIRTIFDTEKGFCVSSRDEPFSRYDGWNDSHRFNDNLVSILPWISSIVVKTINSCNALMTAFAAIIIFPPEIAPGYRVFVRGPATKNLYEILQIFNGSSPWWEPPTTTEPGDSSVQSLGEPGLSLGI